MCSWLIARERGGALTLPGKGGLANVLHGHRLDKRVSLHCFIMTVLELDGFDNFIENIRN